MREALRAEVVGMLEVLTEEVQRMGRGQLAAAPSYRRSPRDACSTPRPPPAAPTSRPRPSTTASSDKSLLLEVQKCKSLGSRGKVIYLISCSSKAPCPACTTQETTHQRTRRPKMGRILFVLALAALAGAAAGREGNAALLELGVHRSLLGT